jgi:hypothetical protein
MGTLRVTIRAAQTNNKSVVPANILIHKMPTITFDKMLQLTRKQADHVGFRAFRRCTLNLARPAKYLSEVAQTSVADFELDFDEAPGGFPDQLLRLPLLPDNVLQRRHSSALLQHAREMERLSTANSASISIEILSARCART